MLKVLSKHGSNLPLCGWIDCFNGVSNMTASAGFCHPGKKKCEVIENVWYESKYQAHMIKETHPRDWDRLLDKIPAILAFRGHTSKVEELKVRPIWCISYNTIV
jgi:hypothetical protein